MFLNERLSQKHCDFNLIFTSDFTENIRHLTSSFPQPHKISITMEDFDKSLKRNFQFD